MKLLFVIISKEDVDQVISGLNKEGFRATKIASSGGFLKKKNVTLMIGVQEDQMKAVIDIVKGICHERQTVEVGGAIIFAVDVSHYEKI